MADIIDNLFYSGGVAGEPKKYYSFDSAKNIYNQIDPVKSPAGDLNSLGDSLITQGRLKNVPTGGITIPIGATLNQGASGGVATNNGTPAPAPAPGTPAPAAPAGSGVGGAAPAAGSALDIINKAANPDIPLVNSDSPEIKTFTDQEKAALETNKQAKLAGIDQSEKKDLVTVTNQNNNSMGMIRNKLAELGLLDNSTASLQYIADTQANNDALVNATKAKYAIQRMDLDATTQQTLIDAVNKQIETVNKQITDRIDQLQKGASVAANVYKTLTDAEAATRADELAKERLSVDKAYNEGKLSIDAYNAKLNEFKIQNDALAQNKEVDIKAYEAETNRMKISPTNRPSYGDWIASQSASSGSSINASDPRWVAKYYQENPVTLKQLNATLNTEQASRKEVVQDMVDKGEISLEQAQVIHPDIAPLLRRKGASVLEKMMYDLTSSAAASTGE